MRADARRNRSAVLDAGARLLAERPTASMQEIADASGVGRTTVYRHFPAREDLVTALVEQVAQEVAELGEQVLSAGLDTEATLRRLAAVFTQLGARWRFLAAQQAEVVASSGETDRRYLDWYADQQEQGALRADLPPVWLRESIRAILVAASHLAEDLGADEAGRLAGETLVSAFMPR